MKKRDFLNTLIHQVVFTIDTLFKDRNVSPVLLDYLYLVCTGMILTYGEEYIEDIYTTLSNVKYREDTLKTSYTKSLFYQNPACHNYKNKIIDYEDIKNIKFNYELQFTMIDSSPIKTLEYLTHELNSILFAKNKHLSLKDNLMVRFNYLTNNVTPISISEEPDLVLNQVFNLLETEEIVKEILFVKNYEITNAKFKKALRMLDGVLYDTYKVEGLDILTNLVRPLYDAKDIHDLIHSPRERKFIEKEIDAVLGKNSYKEICKKIESLWNMITDSNDYNNYYYLSLEYVVIKNDYINKYIHIKCA